MIGLCMIGGPSADAAVQAGATLLAVLVSLAAVVGAYKVGKSQVAIADRQTNILAQQVALEGSKLKADLYDRRLETYEVAVDFLFRLADLNDPVAWGDRRIALARKIGESRFLFGQRIYDELSEIATRADGFRLLRETFDNAIDYDALRRQELMEKITREFRWCADRATSLHEDFEPYLNLENRTPNISN